ncbi:MAG: hypothetical protein JNN00_17480 [Chitinophagaceae bacterium]|nr:hypothetical protein [Chitinophagaceae bacterium]
MKFKQIILISLLALTFIQSLAQSKNWLVPKLYSVDEKIYAPLKKFSWVDTGTLKNSMTIKVRWNTNFFFDQTLDCYTKSFLIEDTIYITGYMIGELGWGFQLILYKDSYIAASFGLSDGKIYKYNKSDTDSTNYIILPNVSQKVVLSKKPVFQDGEIIAGVIELKSIPYYYTNNDRLTIDLKAYFKTAALKESQ